ncbi:MAG: hypothetical protein HYV09_34740 [Deltaproteobacteria bacterium]|nr:hypothetical protein [Deltaproteobacteria bacterium]
MIARRLLPWVALVLTAPFGWMACSTLLGIEEPELRAPPPVADTGVPPEEAGCVPATWPEPPTSEDTADADVSFIVALRSVGLSTDPPNPVTGFDLDGWCTCPAPEACKPRDPDAGRHCDEPNGQDLSLNRDVLKVITQSPSFSPDRLNADMTKGKYGILAEVRGYNGGLDDRVVEVSVFLSSGTTSDAGPSWDGGDPWDLDPSSLASDGGPPASRFVDTSAYVRGGVLVASKLGGVKLVLGTGPESIELLLSQAVMTAKIVKRPSGYALENGVIAGRWPTRNILTAIAPLNAPFLGVPLCSDSAKVAYNYAKLTVCNAADLSSNPSRDKDRGADCDALSFALQFAAEPASFGVLRVKPVPDGGCTGWVDDCNKP